MKIKICGMRDQQNIDEVMALGPDYLGFIFYARSPRYAGHRSMVLPPAPVRTTLVVVDEEIEEVCRLQQLFQFKAIQLHGSESPAYCKQLRQQGVPGIEIFKAFGMKEGFDFGQLQAYEPWVDFFLFDTSTSQKGGSGITFDWNLLEGYILETPYWLSGGLGLEEIRTWYESGKNQGALAGFDLNSRLEISPGLKDVSMVRSILELRDEYLK